MNKKIYTTVFILCFYFAFNFANAQQQTLTSTSQKQCQWNISTQKDENCVEMQKEYSISIDKTEDRIRISHPVKTYIFKIISTEEYANLSVYKVIKATGVGKIITYNSVDNWIKISDEQPTESSITQYYFTK